MNRKHLTLPILVSYYLAGAGAAEWMTRHAHLDSRLSILVLPVLFAIHFGWKAVRRSRRGKAVCAGCQKEIGVFRAIAQQRFCCDEHEHSYYAELEVLAIQRLQAARPAAAPVSQTVLTPVLVRESEENLALIPARMAAFGPTVA